MFVSVCVCVCVCVCVREREREREREKSEFTVFLRLNFALKMLVSEMVILNNIFGYCLNLTSLNSVQDIHVRCLVVWGLFVSANNSRKDYFQCAKEIHKPNYENCLTRRSAGTGVARSMWWLWPRDRNSIPGKGRYFPLLQNIHNGSRTNSSNEYQEIFLGL